MHCQLNKEIERNIKLLSQKEFEGANKPGKLLDWQIKKRKEKKYILKTIFKGKITSDQKTIKKAFRDYYLKLFEDTGTKRRKIESF